MSDEYPELAWLRSKLDEGGDKEIVSQSGSSDTDIKRMKLILKEDTMPLFSDDMLKILLKDADSFNEAVYRAAVMKSEDTTISVSGMSTADTSAYFLRIAKLYRPNNSGILRGD